MKMKNRETPADGKADDKADDKADGRADDKADDKAVCGRVSRLYE